MSHKRIVIHNHLSSRDVNAFEHAVPREAEDANRDKMYRDAGIVRVLASDATHYTVKRGTDEHGKDDWFVQSNKEEVVGDRSFRTRGEAEAFKRQLEAKRR